MATDKELNEYMSIKRIAPYKNRGTWDNDRNEKLSELRNAIASRTWDGVPVSQWVQGSRSGRQSGHRGAGAAPEGGEAKKKKRMGKKERSKLKALAEVGHADTAVEPESAPNNLKEVGGDERDESERPKKKRKKNKTEV